MRTAGFDQQNMVARSKNCQSHADHEGSQCARTRRRGARRHNCSYHHGIARQRRMAVGIQNAQMVDRLRRRNGKFEPYVESIVRAVREIVYRESQLGVLGLRHSCSRQPDQNQPVQLLRPPCNMSLNLDLTVLFSACSLQDIAGGLRSAVFVAGPRC